MKSSPRDVLDGWLGAESAIRDPDNMAAVFDAQSWAAARAVLRDCSDSSC